MPSAVATSKERSITVDGPIAVTSELSTCSRRASAPAASAPSPLKVGNIWMGGVAGELTGARVSVTPAALTPKATVTLLKGPGRVPAPVGMVRETEPAGLG